MRRRLAVVGLVAVAALSGCGGGSAEPPPAVGAPPSGSLPAHSLPSDSALADCVAGITPWLQMYLDGGTDLGDYQEMGLSSAQGGALRELQRQAAALRAQGPLPAGWVATEVQRSCTAIVAARATGTTRPTGWP
ncbi:hypothetical protein [Kitasatospora sp. NPDC097643]|uniref:hypothetical protein n=1 Tax=Kitasatospora sp. NPDC097643 TaxID=3157230 RepID=UPI00332D9327